MATSVTQAVPQPHGHDRPVRRRPFSTWMKKLAGFKNNSSAEGIHGHSRRILYQMKTQGSKRPSKNNNPYPQSGRIGPSHAHNSLPSFSTGPSGITSSVGSLDRSPRSSIEGNHPPTTGARSTIAPTVCTDHEASHSIMAPSHGGASTVGTRTVGGGHDSRRGGDSTFSSPAPSVRSLTTTLTTIQSLVPNGNANTNAAPSNPHHHHHTQQNSIQFSQPFPNTSMSPSPASAIPAHLTPQPTTYTTATANNLLTDNASILTLASSSKRRRRRSFDTDASVRALAPSSLWGGSRESLPLSVLSANIDTMPPATPSGLHSSSRMAERTSIYSATGVTVALNSERNSFYAKQSSITGGAGDGGSVRSGLYGHTRADSTTGSIGGLNSPLASPREANVMEKDEVEEADEALGKGKGKQGTAEKYQD